MDVSYKALSRILTSGKKINQCSNSVYFRRLSMNLEMLKIHIKKSTKTSSSKTVSLVNKIIN